MKNDVHATFVSGVRGRGSHSKLFSSNFSKDLEDF